MIERLRVRIPSEAAGEFSSPESTLCADLFGIRSSLMLQQWHLEDPGPTAKSTRGRLILNMHAPLTQRSQSG